MRNFQDTFETRKQSFIFASLICMTVPLTTIYTLNFEKQQHFFFFSFFFGFPSYELESYYSF